MEIITFILQLTQHIGYHSVSNSCTHYS